MLYATAAELLAEVDRLAVNPTSAGDDTSIEMIASVVRVVVEGDENEAVKFFGSLTHTQCVTLLALVVQTLNTVSLMATALSLQHDQVCTGSQADGHKWN